MTANVINNKTTKSYFVNTSVHLQKCISYTKSPEMAFKSPDMVHISPTLAYISHNVAHMSPIQPV